MRRRRSISNSLFWAGCVLAFVLIVAPSISIIASVFHQAFPALGAETFTQRTNVLGGLQNAILGSLWLLLGVLVLAGSIGVGAGVYLAEYAVGTSEKVLRFFSEVLAGMPSIIVGYVAYVALVVQFHWGYSYLAAVIALSTLVVPYIIKTTEVALRQVPTTLREAATGLGMARTSVLGRILMPAALPAVVSGLILALAISTGELAPLLFTANFTDTNPKLHLLHQSVPYLTGVVYTDLSQPGAKYHATAAAAGLVSLIVLIILIIAGRIVGVRARRYSAQMSL